MKTKQGWINDSGYRMHEVRKNGQRVTFKREHVLIWEAIHGEKPEGYHLHHINGNKLDNRLENLQLLSCQEHKWVESPNYRKEDKHWVKLCPICNNWFSFESFYRVRERRNNSGYTLLPNCKPCERKESLKRYHKKKGRG